MNNSDNVMNSFIAKRKCPRCRGELKTLLNPSEEELKRYGSLSFWERRILKDLYYIENKPQEDNNSVINSILLGSNSPVIGSAIALGINRAGFVRLCDKCNHVWDIFDETAFVLSTNNQKLIQTYISLIERSASDLPRPVLVELKEQHWRMYLIKARLYQYQYKNQSDSQRNDDYDYKQLYDIALQNAENCHTDNQILLSYEYDLKADMSDDILERFNLLNAALTSDISHHRKVRIQNNVNELYSTVLDRWKQPINIEKRRIIFIANNLDDIAGYYDPTHSINHFFTIDRIPASIKFPHGLPQTSTLYIANPARTDEYIPYDNCEELLFMDKIRELRRLLRFMGATEITFTTVKGKSTEEFQKEVQSTSVSGSVLSHKASVGSRFEKQKEETNSRELKVYFIERLDPCDYPSIPENLYWYHDETEWQHNVEARLHSNQLDFKQEISTKQIKYLSEMSQLDVNAAYKNLILKIKAKHHHEQEFHVKTTEETMWRITAEFKPLSEFVNNQNTKSDKAAITDSSTEQEYIKAVKQLREDGEISEPERYLLNKKRDKLGISEQRASELEKSLATQSAEDEQAYLNLYRKYAEAGEITEKRRLILDDAAKTYGLSPERVKHLEAKN